MNHPDVSMGRRLGAGFGLLLLTLAVLIAAVAGWQADSAREQRIFTERILPRAARAGEVERAILYVAIDLRSYLLSAQVAQLQHYGQTADGLRQALTWLAEMPKDPDGERLFQALDAAARTYLAEADAIVRNARGPRSEWVTADAQLAGAREAAVARVRDFMRYHDRNAELALTEMAKAREHVSDSIWVGAAIALLFSLVLAYFTTQSIRRPTRDLLKLARGLSTGDLKPALSWAPGDPSDAPPRSEMLQLAHAFGAAAVAIQSREQRLRAHREIASAVASSLDKERIGAGALAIMVQHVGADAGVLYWNDTAAGGLQPLADYGVEDKEQALLFRDALPREAADSARLAVRRDLPPGTPLKIRRGSDVAPVRAAAAIPILFRQQVLGVIVVATLNDLNDDALSFLDAVGPEVGIGLQNAHAYAEIRLLLEQVQERNERIEQQNEELQAQNEEIQAQHEEIKAQHEEIQTQSEELQKQNDQLRQTGEELKVRAAQLSEADERKNEFLGFLAHELRNPTSAIANGLFVLQRVEPGSNPARNAQAIMQRQTRQLTRLIDDLLDTTRISRGKIELERETIDFIDVVRECVEDYDAMIKSRGIVLDIVLPEEKAWTSGDRTRLFQIVGNLLSNAIKFSDDGGRVAVGVAIHRENRSLELYVRDKGCGIDAALLPRLFTPFTQGSNSLARTKGGLGLGLALVKSLVELHGGTVRAHSDGPGRGAEFVVRLPLAEAPAGIVARPTVVPRNWRVLIVEDNRDAADSLRAGAELQGYDVRVTYDGAACLEIARDFRPQVVLCDIGLPGIDGYEVARRLRADPLLCDVYLIAVSGYASPRDKARAAAAGFDRHVAKPLRMEDLEAMLSELEDGARAAAPKTRGRA